MLKLLGIKDIVYIATIITMLTSAWLSLNSWHYRPIKNLKIENKSLIRQLQIVGSRLNTCENNLTIQNLQGYIEGEGTIDEVINTSLDNLHT